jgi:hypothetical protein
MESKKRKGNNKLIAPVWSIFPWFPTLLELLDKNQLLLPNYKNIFLSA